MFSKIISSPIFKVPLRYGAIAGVLCIIFVITFFYMGHNPFLINPYMDFRILLFSVLIFFSLKELRDFYQNGLLAMWQGMAASLVFLAVASFIAAMGILIFGTVVTEFVSSYIKEFTEQIKNLSEEAIAQLGKDAIERNLKALPATNAGDLAGLYAWQSFVMGFFISVIISVILRRQPKPE
jgi:hypothetical protein